ncbi:prevent-host-death protein [Burkholderia ubonensis]|uniref:hypothetical protein n=1 Tax=Burkholderia ubonensis TaxID=101571 RepID=UPI00075E7A39|nr:hypothetical protein [Burkholderia ubonensis]KVC68868.1 prevent-host-death protein [Burkholderia ubonensis]
MSNSARDVISQSQASANLSELADYYHQLERERIHLWLIEDASKGLADVSAGKVKDARSTLSDIKRHRANKAAG